MCCFCYRCHGRKVKALLSQQLSKTQYSTCGRLTTLFISPLELTHLITESSALGPTSPAIALATTRALCSGFSCCRALGCRPQGLRSCASLGLFKSSDSRLHIWVSSLTLLVFLTNLFHGVKCPQGSPVLLPTARQPSIFLEQNNYSIGHDYTTFPLTKDGHLDCFHIFSFWFYFLTFGCAGSLPQHSGFLQLWRAGAPLYLQGADFSLQWPLLLQSSG